MQTNTAVVIGENRRDLEEYGTFFFPVAAYETCLRKTPLGFYDAHWHNRLHIMYPAAGSSIRVTTETAQHDLHDEDAVFLSEGVLHSVYPLPGRESTFIILLFDKKVISGFPGSGIERDLILPFSSFQEIVLRKTNEAHAEILRHIQNGFAALQTADAVHELVFCTEAMTMWAMCHTQGLLRTKQTNPLSDLGSERAKAMLSFLCKNFSSDLKLEEITIAANISRSQGSSLFKNYVGKTIFEYLLHYRIEKSIELLVQTDRTISYIAYETGFSSASHYIDRFKQIIGMSPGEYRKKHAAGT